MVDLRNRTRIFVPDAACLLGVVDETGLLKPGEASLALTVVAACVGLFDGV